MMFNVDPPKRNQMNDRDQHGSGAEGGECRGGGRLALLPQLLVGLLLLAELVSCPLWAQTNAANARNALQSVWLRHPDDAQIAHHVLKAYLAFGDFTNALQLLNTRLSKSPDDVTDLNNQAAILFASGHPADAIPVLDHVLALTNLPTARFNRASARLASHDYAAAEADYHELEKSGMELGRANYGLAVIAESRHDTNQAIHYLRLCLTNTPIGTPFWRQVSVQLQALDSGVKAK